MSLADVMPNCLETLAGRRSRIGLPPVEKAVVVVVDGLGHAQLAEHAGHARTLAARLPADAAIGSGFPTTTVAALTSLTTGEPAGRHGLVGYRVLDPATDRVINQLSGWEGLDPARWQRMPTVFERAAADGIRTPAITHARYRHSPLTLAMLRGAEFLAATDAASRRERLREVLAAPGRALVYYYVADLDVAGHAHGVASGEWVAALEALDAELAGAIRLLGSRDGLVVTADHGMVDVPPHAQRLVPPALLEGVRHVAGEPRCLQLHLEPGADPEELAARWRAHEGRRAWVGTRAEALAAGWFGAVDPEVEPRIGQVLVAARGDHAYYADPDDTGRRMVGQHGSLTPAETAVPLLRFGAYAAG
ncbi:alkaline phosphatase family protein [Protaetiibacter intestinalis]|uniref:alkaline phosphatase family protein n=1 Tax=Protaetiibacter intestinalis TaxID=2419774 RepID=UPI001D03600F|nr:alkaline phosphatase family protein [Protaetiibacter intestinalis]